MSERGVLEQFLLGLLEGSGGAVRFDRWMGEALHNPVHGYYARGIRGIGARGDFDTWPGRDRSLADALAAWFQGGPLMEAGAGTGQLAAAVLARIPWWRRPVLHIVETSHALQAIQEQRLGRRARWHTSPVGALQACGGRAAIYCNELADAFPCRVFRKTCDGWEELHIGLVGGAPSEVWRTALALPISGVFSHGWEVGQRVEVQESFHQWMRSFAGVWNSGRLLIIDYGGEATDIYRRRPGGTLRAYEHHRRHTGPDVYSGFGRRDITADVNFGDLVAVGTGLGWTHKPPEALGEFLVRHGVPPPPDLADAAEAFRVVEFGAGRPG